jgi:phosphomannomutase
MPLMVSISGVRGILGESLTPEVVVRYAAAFSDYTGRGRVVMGRDGRATGRLIGQLVSSTLLAAGCDVVALGVVPTPTICLAVEKLRAAGGISITASHNPMEWNGLKFIGSGGMFLNAPENERLWEIAARGGFPFAPWNGLGTHTRDESSLRVHTETVLGLPCIRTDVIRERHFRVVADCINAAGGIIVPAILRQLGCEVVEMNCEGSGVFARMPEPVPENLHELCARVKAEKADLGIAVDPDVDRLVLITEKGEPFGEEYTVTAAVKYILQEAARTHSLPAAPVVVVNLSTTRAVEDVAGQFGARVIRTPVGEINVAERMKEVGALVGGEGSGGVILPAVHYTRDAIVGIALILQLLAESGGTLSGLKSSLPEYVITKSKIDVHGKDPGKVLEALRRRAEGEGRVNCEDGLKIDYGMSWVHLRKSNTEPIIRIIAEAPTRGEAARLLERFRKEIE